MTDRQRALLQWLSQRERAHLIWCDGPDLAALVNHGLAVIEPPPPRSAPMFSRVSITDDGRELLEEIAEGAS